MKLDVASITVMDGEDEVNGASVPHRVEIPVQLTSATGRRFMQWCQETACLLDTLEVASADVIEALIDQLEDPRTSQVVRQQLAEQAPTLAGPEYTSAHRRGRPLRGDGTPGEARQGKW